MEGSLAVGSINGSTKGDKVGRMDGAVIAAGRSVGSITGSLEGSRDDGGSVGLWMLGHGAELGLSEEEGILEPSPHEGDDLQLFLLPCLLLLLKVLLSSCCGSQHGTGVDEVIRMEGVGGADRVDGSIEG